MSEWLWQATGRRPPPRSRGTLAGGLQAAYKRTGRWEERGPALHVGWSATLALTPLLSPLCPHLCPQGRQPGPAWCCQAFSYGISEWGKHSRAFLLYLTLLLHNPVDPRGVWVCYTLGRSLAPAAWPAIELNSDTSYLESVSDPTGSGPSPASLHPTSDTSLRFSPNPTLWGFLWRLHDTGVMDS